MTKEAHFGRYKLTYLQIARIFNRYFAPIERACNEGREADYGFDYGEFSSGTHDRLYEEQSRQAMYVVARCCDVQVAQVVRALRKWEERLNYVAFYLHGDAPYQ